MRIYRIFESGKLHTVLVIREGTMLNRVVAAIGLATKWLRILPLGGNDKIRNHLVANPIDRTTFYGTSTFRIIFSNR